MARPPTSVPTPTSFLPSAVKPFCHLYGRKSSLRPPAPRSSRLAKFLWSCRYPSRVPSSSMTTSPAPLPAASHCTSLGWKSLSWPMFCTSTLMFGLAAWKSLTAASNPGEPKYCSTTVTGPLSVPPLVLFFLLHPAAPSARPAVSAAAATTRSGRELTIILTPLWAVSGGWERSHAAEHAVPAEWCQRSLGSVPNSLPRPCQPARWPQSPASSRQLPLATARPATRTTTWSAWLRAARFEVDPTTVNPCPRRARHSSSSVVTSSAE